GADVAKMTRANFQPKYSAKIMFQTQEQMKYSRMLRFSCMPCSMRLRSLKQFFKYVIILRYRTIIIKIVITYLATLVEISVLFTFSFPLTLTFWSSSIDSSCCSSKVSEDFPALCVAC